MNKTTQIIIISILAIAIIAVLVIVTTNNESSNLLEVSSAQDLTKMVDKVYDGVTVELYNTETREIDLTDDTSVNSYTGLENGENLEFAVVSEPMVNAQAYSLVMAKVKDGVNANEVAKAMSEGVNTRKWICVSAEKLYATNSGNIVFLVMTDEDKATDIYNSFKKLTGKVGELYEKTEQEEELPPDMSFPVPE